MTGRLVTAVTVGRSGGLEGSSSLGPGGDGTGPGGTRMDKRYEAYALADRHFYETPDRLSAGDRAGHGGARLRDGRACGSRGLAGRPDRGLADADPGRRRRAAPSRAHPGLEDPRSATRENAERIAAIVWDYCVPRGDPVQVPAGPASAAPAQRQVRRPRRQWQVRHGLPGRRGPAATSSLRRAGRAARGRATARTSSATCAGATDRCTCATAASPRALRRRRRAASSCPAIEDGEGNWCPTRGTRPSRSPTG